MNLTVEQLRKRIQIRLADRRLAPILVGIYKLRRGTGGVCSACLRSIEPSETEYEVGDGARDALIAHEVCYTLWRAESIAFAKANDPRQQRPRS
jgi:hypothetical protein